MLKQKSSLSLDGIFPLECFQVHSSICHLSPLYQQSTYKGAMFKTKNSVSSFSFFFFMPITAGFPKGTRS